MSPCRRRRTHADHISHHSLSACCTPDRLCLPWLRLVRSVRLVQAEQLQEAFGMLGVVARKKQKRGYPDQWPFKINIYAGPDGK